MGVAVVSLKPATNPKPAKAPLAASHRLIREGVAGYWRADGLFELTGWLIYDLGRKNSGLRVWVPAGYATDFASIPALVQWAVPKFGAHDAPAVLHDWLYNTHLVSKPIADAVFYEALLVCGVRPSAAWLMYQAVAAFGHGGYANGPAELRRRAPHWAKRIFDSPALPGRNKEDG